MTRLTVVSVSLVVWGTLSGCAASIRHSTGVEQAAAAARPILNLDANANWTECLRALAELGPASVAYLMERPAMTRRAAPDDLCVLMHTSLTRLLIQGPDAPPLSANALETTLGILHLDLKVRGERIGTIVMPEPTPPRAWHELYPADFNHELAARIDVEGDRTALREWWDRHRSSGVIPVARPTRPRPAHLWRLLDRRYADGWLYQPEPGTVLCGDALREPVLLQLVTYDYNLVRAVCIWLGSRPDGDVRDRLIGLVAHASRTIAHNARFALQFAPDPRIRNAIERHENRAEQRNRPREPSATL